MQQLKIDPGFKILIPPLAPEEYKQLEKNIVADGCRDALVVWNGAIVDGHNRYEICTKHNLPFNTVEHSFSSREDAIIWICNNQQGRRNLAPEQLKYIMGKAYEAMKVKEARNQYSPKKISASAQNAQEQKSRQPTAELIGKQYNVNQATVRRSARYARAVDKIGADSPEVQKKILSGQVHAPTKKIVEIAEKPEPERKAIVRQLEQGRAVDEILPKKSEEPPVFQKPSPEESKRIFKETVADLKSDHDRSMTNEQFMMEYTAFAEDMVHRFEWYKQPMYTELYPRLTDEEHKEIAALTTSIVKAAEQINELMKGQSK